MTIDGSLKNLRSDSRLTRLTIEDVIYALETPYPDFEIKRGKTALVLIDIQKIASPEPFVKAAIKKGFPEKEVQEAVADYEALPDAK
jgi:hypothetical protein